MKILAIETSCDETALSLLSVDGGSNDPQFSVLGHVVLSQAQKHAEFGGVFPNLSKREHAKNCVPVFQQVLGQANQLESDASTSKDNGLRNQISQLLEREPSLFENLWEFVGKYKRPDIDHIVVTNGPGLEPALWVGINFAKALSIIWDIPVTPVNHMEGHILSILMEKNESVFTTRSIKSLQFPALALLISGGHTQLVLVKSLMEYQLLGETRDDAVGEAFDKVARMLGLEYPGGPKISALAGSRKSQIARDNIKFPRPMLNSDNYDFSFSGLKTSVLYRIKELEPLSETIKIDIAWEFEHAVTEVLVKKTQRALDEYGAQTLIIAGGVAANKFIRNTFEKVLSSEYPSINLLIPSFELATDNSLMIGIAGYFHILDGEKVPLDTICANGNLTL